MHYELVVEIKRTTIACFSSSNICFVYKNRQFRHKDKNGIGKEEEDFNEKQELFEYKFNTRFEHPDREFVRFSVFFWAWFWMLCFEMYFESLYLTATGKKIESSFFNALCKNAAGLSPESNLTSLLVFIVSFRESAH